MNYSPLRLMTIIASLFIVFFLKFFTSVNQEIIISITLILIFLIIFTFIFKIKASANLKVSIILFIFIILPLFILYYSGFFDSLTGVWDVIATTITVIILGILSIKTIVELNYIEINYGGECE